MSDINLFQRFAKDKKYIMNLHYKGVSKIDIAKKLSIKYVMNVDSRRLGEFINLMEIIRATEDEGDWDVGTYDPQEVMKLFADTYSKVSGNKNRVIKTPSVSNKYNNELNILNLTDLHIGQIIKGPDVNNFNEYSVDIISERLNTILEYIKNNVKNKEKLYVFTLGDLIHGELPHHQDFSKTMEYGIITQCMEGVRLLTHFFSELLKMFKEVEVFSVVGNHGRLPNKPSMPNVDIQENFDWLVIEMLSREFKSISRLKINNYPSLYKIIKLHNKYFAITHGHGLSIGSNGVKSKLFTNFNALYSPDRTVDFLIHGHFHHNVINEFPHERFLVGGGSLVGADPYAMNQLLKASSPSQLLLQFYVEDDKLRLSSFNPIWV